MPLQRHHKIIIGGVSSLLILVIIANSIFMYWVYTKDIMNYNELNNKINSLQNDTQVKFNDLSTSILNTRNDLSSLGLQVGSINQSISQLKASVSSDFSSVFEKAVKSVVWIKTDVGSGSGFFIANGGYIVTNEHVMAGATEATIITYDENQHSVSLVGEDTNMDIALLKINSTAYAPLNLGNSDNIVQGEKVIAIGNPYGLSFSVSEGIVSNIHQPGANGLNVYIQTDASLNPGNSGGPLIDVNGDVIGMNNFKLNGSENIGFALESNSIKSTVNNIYSQIYKNNLI